MDFVSELRESYSKTRIVKKPALIEQPAGAADILTSYTGLSPQTRAVAMMAPMILSPTFTFAADIFADIHTKAMTLFDGGVVLLIIFAGGAWAIGHRSRAIELLLCVSCGFLVARNAINIRDYLKTIGG